MDKNECFEMLDKLSEYNDGWGNDPESKGFCKCLIENCRNIVERMTIAPDIRPLSDGSIAFDFDGEELELEVTVACNSYTGFISNPLDRSYTSTFVFENLDDVVGFWNTVITLAFSYDGCRSEP